MTTRPTEVASAVDNWQHTAREAGMAAADIVLMAGAFSAHFEHRGVAGG